MSTYVRRQEVSHPIGATGRLTIRVTEADVRLTGADTERAELVATFEIDAASDEEASRIFDAIKLRVSHAPDDLAVEQSEESSRRNPLLRLIGRSSGASLQIEATLPRRASVRVETVSGDVSGNELYGEQRYAAVSGDLILLDGAGSVRLNTVSGDALLRALGALSLRAETVSGDVGVTAPRFDALRTSTVSGDVDLEGALHAGGEFRIETVSGDVAFGPVGSATFEVRGLSTDISSDIDHRIEGRADRRRVTIEGGGPELVFSSMSGDFHVRRPRNLDRDVAPRTPPNVAHDHLDVLRALERGEIDVEEATRRLAGE